MTIPNDPNLLAGWLEAQIMSPVFVRFISELSAINPERPRSAIPV